MKPNRHVKPRILNVNTKNWNVNVNVNILNGNCMSLVLDTHFTHKSSRSHLTKYQCFKKQVNRLKNMYHKYNSVEAFYESFKQEVLISFVMTKDGKYY